jgi:hypothetical protein
MPVAIVPPASASNAAFYTIFGIFVAAMLVLIVVILVWAIRHDLAGRAAWRRRQEAARQAAGEPARPPTPDRPSPPPHTQP